LNGYAKIFTQPRRLLTDSVAKLSAFLEIKAKINAKKSQSCSQCGIRGPIQSKARTAKISSLSYVLIFEGTNLLPRIGFLEIERGAYSKMHF
jgi:hypothetical protein